MLRSEPHPAVRRAAALFVLVCSAVLAAAGTAHAQGPWPAIVEGASNPLRGTPYPANGSNATPNARIVLRLRHRGRLRTQVSHPVGARPVLRGRISNRRTGKAIRGAVLVVARQIADQPGWRAVTTVRTSRQGRFTARMAAGWSSRRFAVLYWPYALSPAPVFSRRVLARATPRVWFRVTARRGGLVSMRGRVTGARIPSGGLVVALQVRNRGGWVGVRLVRTTGSGRFAGRYRFSARGRRYTLRAHVPRQPQWRLHTGQSRKVRVLAR